jgi:hypothetical protein
VALVFVHKVTPLGNPVVEEVLVVRVLRQHLLLAQVLVVVPVLSV